MNLAPDEMKVELERMYDAARRNAEETENMAEASHWEGVALHLQTAIDMLDAIERGCVEFCPEDMYLTG